MNDIESKAAELEKEIVPSLALAREIVVTSPRTYEIAGNTLKDLTAIEKRIAAYWESDVATAHKLHRSLVAKREAMLGPVGEIKKALVVDMKRWADDQERERREAQARAEADARRRAEAESAVTEVAVAPDPVVVPKTVPSGFGTYTRKTWRAEVVDVAAFIKAVADGRIPVAAIEPNTAFLNNQARAMRSTMNYPGVRVFEQ